MIRIDVNAVESQLALLITVPSARVIRDRLEEVRQKRGSCKHLPQYWAGTEDDPKENDMSVYSEELAEARRNWGRMKPKRIETDSVLAPQDHELTAEERAALEPPGEFLLDAVQGNRPATLNGFPVVNDRELSMVRPGGVDSYAIPVVRAFAAVEMDGPPLNVCDKDCSGSCTPVGSWEPRAEITYPPVYHPGHDPANVLALLVDCSAITIDELREKAGLPPLSGIRGADFARRQR